MSTLNDRLNIIHQFENGELEFESFQELMEQDPLLKEEYEFGLSIEEAILDDDIQSFKEIVANAQKEYVASSKEPRKKSIYFFSRRIAASVSVIILFFAAYFSINSVFFAPENTSLGLQKYNKYYTPFELIDKRVSTLTSENRKYAYQAYEEQDFALARTYFEKITDKEDWEKICLANCYIEQEDIHGAIKILEPIAIDSNDLLVKNYALWYISLCQLKNGNIQIAQKNLERVKDSFGQTNVIRLSELLLNEL